MKTHHPMLAGVAILFALAVATPPATAFGQEGDADLDGLLNKIEKKDAPTPAPTPTPAPAAKPDDKAGAAAPKDQAKPKGEVESKDQAIDDLLKKFGEPADAPETKSAPKPPGGGNEATPAEMKKDGRLTDSALDPKQKPIDTRLEEILGRVKKNKDQQDPESGMLAETIKEMRDVQKKLSEPDTGEQTQAKQKEILKKLETAMKQARQSGMGQRRQRGNRQQRPQGEQQQQNDPANDPKQGTGPGKPDKPKPKTELVNGKSIWGHLPPELRQEMNNITRETMLESRKNLIERYYLSVSKKSSGTSAATKGN